MNDIANDFGDRMASLGIGSTTGTVTIFNQRLPSSPDNAIAIRSMAGSEPVRAMGPVSGPPILDRPGVQILIRNLKLVDLDAKVRAVRDAFDWWHGTINGHVYRHVRLAYQPVYLGVDENNRHQASVNFDIDKER